MPDSESVAPLILYLPEKKLLIAGDHALQDQHLWLAEGRSNAWLNNIRTILGRWSIDQVLPGHGTPGGSEILEDTFKYIENFHDAIKLSINPIVAKRRILDIYPNHRFTAALDVSLPVYFN